MRGNSLFQSLVVIFVLLSEVNYICSLKNKNRPCDQKGPCLCVFSSGSSVDLSKLPKFDWVKLNETADILFHPCYNSNLTVDKECISTSICLRNNDTADAKSTSYHYTNLGYAEEGKFSDKIEEPLTIDFHNRGTSVVLICDSNQNPSKLNAKKEGDRYILELTSPNSCHTLLTDENPSRMSTGSTLVLIFFVLFLTYFGGGMLTLRLLRGAEGKEMIPNYEFWSDLPYLVRDGILFTLSGFQASPSYDRI